MGAYFSLASQGLKLFRKDPIEFFRKLRRYTFYRPMPAPYRKQLEMTLREWLIYHEKYIHLQKCRWMGIKALKNPLDAWIYQEILYDVKPEVVVEIGSACGGTTLYLAHLLDVLGKGLVVSVDMDRSAFSARHPRIALVTGDSASPEVIAEVSKLCRGRSTLVIHDANHRKDHVLKDLETYSPWVSIGSYFIVEDTIQDVFEPGDGLGGFGEGPQLAVEEFLKNNPNFAVDAERERYLLTYNPKGFLKRLR